MPCCQTKALAGIFPVQGSRNFSAAPGKIDHQPFFNFQVGGGCLNPEFWLLQWLKRKNFAAGGGGGGPPGMASLHVPANVDDVQSSCQVAVLVTCSVHV